MEQTAIKLLLVILILLIIGIAGLLWMRLGPGQQAAPPTPNTMAPPLQLPDQHGKQHALEDYRGRWVVLYFYPKDDTPGCTEQACKFRDDLQALTRLGAQILGVSVDDSASHAAFAEKYALPFPLLADENGSTAAQYGALFDLGVAKFARRYTFLIDPEGRIAKVYLKVDTSRHSQEIIDDLRSLQAARADAP